MPDSNLELIRETTDACNRVVCEQYPDLQRLNYCHGQMLNAQDFVDEQNYYLNKIALLTRCLHGYGVVCGLKVAVSDDRATRASGQPRHKPKQPLLGTSSRLTASSD